MSEVYYEVRVRYYQYNNGDGQCGERETYLMYKSERMAATLVNKINRMVGTDIDDEEHDELVQVLLPSHGYFIKASSYLVIKELVHE